MTELTARELLVMLYEVALDSVDGRFLVNQWCRQHSASSSAATGTTATAGDDDKKSFTHCVAIGKAGAAMLQGALDNYPSIEKSLLICPPSKITRQIKKNKTINAIASSHPVPDERSIEAGQALTTFVSKLNESDELLFLISGGTSSLVEVPAENITLEQLQKINTYLLASGKDIQQINAWRKQFSQIKSGGLLRYIKSVSITQLLLSDVKGDKAEIIGSGLLASSNSTSTAQTDNDKFLSAFLEKDGLDKNRLDKNGKAQSISLASSLASDLTSRGLVETHIIGNIQLAMQAVHQAALAEGLNSYIDDEFVEGDACLVADRLYKQFENAKPGVYIMGGETTVNLPDSPGIGGRNQTLALAFARHLSDDSTIHFLAAGTDGVDGNSNCAGAIVSKNTAIQAKKMGYDIDTEIEKANAGLLLMATDDLVQGVDSQTNVMDIIIAYIT